MGSNKPKTVILLHDSESESERERNVKETTKLFKNKNPATIYQKKEKFSDGLLRQNLCHF